MPSAYLRVSARRLRLTSTLAAPSARRACGTSACHRFLLLLARPSVARSPVDKSPELFATSGRLAGMAALDPHLARIARENDGLVTRTLTTAGHLSPSLLRASLRGGAVRRIRDGVFVSTERWASANRHERFVLTVRGILLTHPDWIASHHAALALHGLPLHDVDLDVVDVVGAFRASKIRPGLRAHLATAEQLTHAAEQDPRCVSVADACVLTAAASGFAAGLVAMDAALHRNLVTVEQLRAALTLPGARYGIGAARAAIEATDRACESPGESLTRALLVQAGFDVRSQVWLADTDGNIGRVDFLVGDRVVVEFDGAVKYDGIDGKRELVKEKRREDRLRAAGFRVVRVMWEDLQHPERLTRRIRRELDAAA